MYRSREMSINNSRKVREINDFYVFDVENFIEKLYFLYRKTASSWRKQTITT